MAIDEILATVKDCDRSLVEWIASHYSDEALNNPNIFSEDRRWIIENRECPRAILDSYKRQSSESFIFLLNKAAQIRKISQRVQ